MAGKKVVIQDTVFQNSGGLRIGPNAAIEIRDADSDVLVTLWEDREAASGESNPFSADANGQFTVYADPGRVKITVTISGDTRDWVDVWLLDVTADGILNIDQIDEHTSGGGIQIDGVPEIGNAVRLDRDKNCLLHMPLKNSLSMPLGVGSATFARSTIGTYIDRYGVLQIAAIDEPRFEKNGFLIEGASTNNALHSADLANVAWAKTTATGVKDAIGRDGIASSASTLTATSGNATCLQNITIGSAEQTYSVAIKRKTGSGTVEITIDNGATWMDITAFLSTTDWYEAEVTQTLANPTFGIRLVTSSDAVLVDANQTESLPFASSYIPTTTVPVARTAESLTLTIAGNIGLQADAGTIFCDIDIFGNIAATNQFGVSLRGETSRAIGIGGPGGLVGDWGDATRLSSGIFPSVDEIFRLAIRHDGSGGIDLWVDGVELDSDIGSDVTDSLGSVIDIGHGNGIGQLFGHISNVRIYDRALSDREMAVA